VASGRLSPPCAVEIALAGGRPQIDLELRTLIRQMSMENFLWGHPRASTSLGLNADYLPWVEKQAAVWYFKPDGGLSFIQLNETGVQAACMSVDNIF